MQHQACFTRFRFPILRGKHREDSVCELIQIEEGDSRFVFGSACRTNLPKIFLSFSRLPFTFVLTAMYCKLTSWVQLYCTILRLYILTLNFTSIWDNTSKKLLLAHSTHFLDLLFHFHFYGISQTPSHISSFCLAVIYQNYILLATFPDHSMHRCHKKEHDLHCQQWVFIVYYHAVLH